jgi:hypothetical protein
MGARRTRAKDLRRKAAIRPERKTVVIFCEGEASEPDYINGLKRLPNIRGNTAIKIEIAAKQGVPLTLVKLAIVQLADDEVDECWCVFDIEWPQNHPNLIQAIALAKDHGIRLVVSNPSFEVWLILHFENHTAFITTNDAERKSRQLDGRSGKRIDAELYLPRRGVASERAEQLARRHEGNGTFFPRNNPSSSMYEFLATVEPTED